MLVNTIQTSSQFMDQFIKMDRNNFSYEGYIALFDYLDMLSEDIGENIEMDVIAICCEYTEYENISELVEAYSNLFDDHLVADINANKDDIEQFFYDNTQVISFNNGSYIIADF